MRRPLGLWQRAMALAARTHRAVRKLPAGALDGSPRACSAACAPARVTTPAQDYAGFLRASAGSLFELQALMTAARDLQLLDSKQFRDIWSTTQKLELKLTNLAEAPRTM